MFLSEHPLTNIKINDINYLRSNFKISEKNKGLKGGLAQWESAAFARQKSRVQIPCPPPFFFFKINKLRIYIFSDII